MTAPAFTHVVLDAHVHLYERFDLTTLLDAARRNVEQVLSAHDLSATSTGVCLLCVDLQTLELASSIERLQQLEDYQISAVEACEPHSRHITHLPTGLQWQIVWGYQIICEENLEVLAFGLPEKIPNGTGIDNVLEALQGSAFGILPWGVGKWTGSRGKKVSTLIESSSNEEGGGGSQWWVGDNSGRLNATSTPSQISRAKAQGRWDIPGSDPLPFANAEHKVGSRGAILQGHYDAQAPLGSIRQLLSSATEQPQVFGKGESLLRFLQCQFGMQWRKRFSAS